MVSRLCTTTSINLEPTLRGRQQLKCDSKKLFHTTAAALARCYGLPFTEAICPPPLWLRESQYELPRALTPRAGSGRCLWRQPPTREDNIARPCFRRRSFGLLAYPARISFGACWGRQGSPWRRHGAQQHPCQPFSLFAARAADTVTVFQASPQRGRSPSAARCLKVAARHGPSWLGRFRNDP